MIENVPIASFLYNLAKDLYLASRRVIRGRRRQLSQADRIQLRAKWKADFEEAIREQRRRHLREDVIIRDVRRLDAYPHGPAKRRGISPWFRVGLVGTYHRGVQIGLRVGEVVQDAESGQWFYADRANEEEERVTAILIGLIPYEYIEDVDWDGDEFYGYPHLYCHFEGPRGEPYEALEICLERRMPGPNDYPVIYYEKLDDYAPVRKRSRRRGIRSFG